MRTIRVSTILMSLKQSSHNRTASHHPLNTAISRSCGHKFCFRCLQDAHAPALCKSVKAWQKQVDDKTKGPDAKAMISNDMGDVKPCPNPDCAIASTKISGCMFLSCTKCNESWCWQCGDWGGGKSGRPSPHHVYDCNRPINKDWLNSGSDLFTNDGRFQFYFERYNNHGGALTVSRRVGTWEMEHSRARVARHGDIYE